MSYIKFVEVPFEGKTKRWEVQTKDTNVPLGRIQWFGPWRKYAFDPAWITHWDEECLREVADFVEARTKEHKLSGVGKKTVP